MDPFMIGFGAFLLLMAWLILRHYRSSNVLLEASKRWATTRGEIVSAEVKRKPGSKPTWEGRITYRFDANGEAHTSRAVMIGGEVYASQTFAEKRVAKYPAGSSVDVYYDPADPSRCCLERQREGAWLELLGAAFGLVAGGALLVKGLGL